MIVAVVECVEKRIKPQSPELVGSGWSHSSEFEISHATWFIDLDKLAPTDPYRKAIEKGIRRQKRLGDEAANWEYDVVVPKRHSPTHFHSRAFNDDALTWTFPMTVEAHLRVLLTGEYVARKFTPPPVEVEA